MSVVIAEIRNSRGELTGRIETTGDNGQKILSFIQDPAELRIVVLESKLESNLGKISIGIERADGSGIDDEMVRIGGRLHADKRGAAFDISLAPARGEPVQEVLYIDNRTAVFHVDVVAPNLGGEGGGGGLQQPNQLIGSTLCAQWQDDPPSGEYGRLVIYRMNGFPHDSSRWTAIGEIPGEKLR